MADTLILCLELETVNTDDFRPLLDSLAGQGITFRSLTEEQHLRPETWLARFADLDNASRAADPFAPRTPAEIAIRITDLGPEPGGCVVADDGTRLIGYTCFGRASGEDARRARQGWTGVRPDFRRIGVATALKVQGILLAQRLGYERMVTDPRVENTASVRMSLKVGYHPCDTDAGTV